MNHFYLLGLLQFVAQNVCSLQQVVEFCLQLKLGIDETTKIINVDIWNFSSDRLQLFVHLIQVVHLVPLHVVEELSVELPQVLHVLLVLGAKRVDLVDLLLQLVGEVVDLVVDDLPRLVPDLVDLGLEVATLVLQLVQIT